LGGGEKNDNFLIEALAIFIIFYTKGLKGTKCPLRVNMSFVKN